MKLWKKLSCIGIRGKMLKIISGMYGCMISCVRSKNSISDFFKSQTGFLQGEILPHIILYLCE